ncbi:EXPH5 protein, partial [Poecile atricapillus]|nr:EXPH5 protein [Poecile atricapillus]
AEMCNSPMSAETSAHSFDTNQNETMEKSTLEWNEQLEKEIFSVLSDLDDQLAQEQTQDPLERTVPTSSTSNVQSSSAFPVSKRQTASRGQQRNDWRDMPSTFFPDGLRTLRAKDEHKIFIRPRNLYPPSVTQNSGFRHKGCMNRDAAGRSYSVCSLRRCPSSVSSDQLSASSLQHPLARESKNGFVPRLGRQNPKRIPLSSIVWNNTPDSSEQTPETMFRTQSLMEFHATDHGRYPSSLQETKKYPSYHSKHHYRRSISSSNCFSRVSCPDKAPSPLLFDNWENYPLYKSENNLSRSYYRDTSSHGKLYANQKNSYGRKDSYPSWADIPQCYSDEVFISPDASFEVFMANLNDHQWTHTKNAKFGSQRLQNNFPINSENIYMHSFDGDPNTSENSLSYFCLGKGTEKMSTSPCIRRFHKQESSPRHTSSCSITGSPGRNSSKSSDPLVIYYTLPRKSASIAGSIMSETPISLPRESKTTYDYNSEDADLPCPKEKAQSPRIQNKKNEGHVSLENVFFPTTSEKEVPSYSSDQVSSVLVTPQNLRTAADSEEENSHLSPSSEKSNSQTLDLGLESKSQPISPSATTSYPLDEEKGRAISHVCTPPSPLLTDKNSNTYINSCLQADTCPEQNLTSQRVLGQRQNTSQPTGLENANLNSCQLRKSHVKSQRERHLSEGVCARESLETSASGSNILPKDGIHGKRFKSYSELLSCDENENWASDDEKCYSTRNLMYPSVEFGIFGKEQQLAFLENIKRSLTEGRLWRPCLLNNPGAFRDTESSSINRAELLSSSSAGSKMSSAASSPRELTDTYVEDPAAYSDSDSDTTTDDEYYLDEIDKESEL